MRIGVDVRYISHGLTGGVRTYVYHLAKELPHAAPQHEFYLYADAKAPFELPHLPANVVLRTLPWTSGVSSIRNDRLIGRYMERDRVDIVHAPGNYGPKVNAPLVVTLHDALNLFPMSQHLRGFGRRPRQIALMMYLGHQTRTSLRRAARLITVSQHARHDIAAKTGFPLDHIDVTYEAASDEFRLISQVEVLQACRKRFRLRSPFVLADGIKNAQATVEAYTSLPRQLQDRIELVFFSRESTPRPDVASALVNPHVRFIAQPTTDELVKLMNLATVFAFPSWYEGFGLPLVEAMRCGLPIVASSRAAIPEIVGDAGTVFDLEDPPSFSAQLRALLENAELRDRLRTAALARGRTFEWCATARQTVSVYESVHAVHAGKVA